MLFHSGEKALKKMDLITGLATGIAPPLFDLATGASRKRRQAVDAQQAELQRIINELTGEVGTNLETSAPFKTQMTALNKQYDRQSDRITQDAAAQGLTDEAKLGRISTTNDALNAATGDVIVRADEQRKRLKDRIRALTLEKLGLATTEASEGANAQALWMTQAASLVPYLTQDPKLQSPGAGGGGTGPQ